MRPTISANYCVLRVGAREFISTLSPDRMRLTIGLKIDVTPAPTSPIGAPVGIQAVVDQSEKARRVALHDEHETRVAFSQRALRANILIQPLIRDSAGI